MSLHPGEDSLLPEAEPRASEPARHEEKDHPNTAKACDRRAKNALGLWNAAARDGGGCGARG